VSAALALALLTAGEVQPRPIEWEQLSPEVFDRRWVLPEAPPGPGELLAEMEALVALRFVLFAGDGKTLRCLGDLVAASVPLAREERPAWLAALAERAPALFEQHGEVLSQLLLDDWLHSSEWKPEVDHHRDGLLLAERPHELAGEGARWNGLKQAPFEQGAVLVRADAATFKAVENDYRVYPDDVGASYEWIRPAADGYRTGEDPAGRAFSTLRLGMRCDLPLPFSHYDADIRILNRIDAAGRLVTDVYSTSDDFHWLAGRDVFLAVANSAGEPVATLVVRLYGFDLAGVPDGRKHRKAALRGSLGNLKRKAEREFAAAQCSFPTGSASVPDFRVLGS
jgi:hypothetical protein